MILVVSQNRPIQYLIHNQLRKKYKHSFTNAGKALQTLKNTESIHLVIADLDSDTEAVSALCRYLLGSYMHTVPLILLGTEASIQQFSNIETTRQPDAIFHKPFNPEHLAQQIEQLAPPEMAYRKFSLIPTYFFS
jgi:CheY-like chemotaxis protein